MYSRSLYAKIVGSALSLVLLSTVGAWLLITGVSYTLAFGCLMVMLLITLFIIRLANDTNRRISTFFESLRDGDTTVRYPEETNDPFLQNLYAEMNRITNLFGTSRIETEEKQLYYESILRVLTHEIRNSITPIASLSADLLRQNSGNTSGELQDGLEVINNQARNLAAFLDSYHRLTHLPDPQKQPVDVRELFTKLNRLLCAEPDSWRVQYRCEEDYELQADPNLLVLALINLIRNALQAVADRTDGAVRVEVAGNKEHPFITIADNGPGIPAERLSAIFTPFFSTKAAGSGIGLPISRRIMQLHGGQLSVSSIPEVRTVFTMEF